MLQRKALQVIQGPPPPPDLDSAVALIELGGHTHILAREALAVIDAAQCARGAAIMATGANGPASSTAAGWDEPAALAVARKPAACEVIAARRASRRAVAARRRSPARARASLHPHRDPQADRHGPDARPLPPRRAAARRAVAGRGARRRSREHLGLRADVRGPRRRAPHRADAALDPPDRRDRHRQGNARARDSPRLRSRRSAAAPVQLHRRARAT